MDYSIQLHDGTRLDGNGPLVVIGPNGSGKTRRTRELIVPGGTSIEFVNALRNTRVAPNIPAMGYDDARNNFVSQRTQARNAHWELASDFDYLLSQLLADDAMKAKQYVSAVRGGSAPSQPDDTALSGIEAMWAQLFPGRELDWKDWKPLVRNATGSDSPVEYSGNQMSDGEKAALYLAGRIYSADPGIIVIDEPETHLHSLLAIRLWNLLEAARPDMRFVYITHDLTFALSRKGARFLLASPVGGLRALELGDAMPDEVAEALLGAASLSFYASRVVFCEGEETSLDYALFSAWFNGEDTVVRNVGSSQMVLRCVEAMRRSGVATSLTAIGVIDRDFHPNEFLSALPAGVHPLGVHEIESLFCLPSIVRAVLRHHGKEFDEEKYIATLGAQVTERERHKVVVERWKRRMEPLLTGLVSKVSARDESLDALLATLPELFDHTKWNFSPAGLLKEEKDRVEVAVPSGAPDELLQICPGKPFLAMAAKHAGMDIRSYVDLVTTALAAPGESLVDLGHEVELALEAYLPPRQHVKVA